MAARCHYDTPAGSATLQLSLVRHPCPPTERGGTTDASDAGMLTPFVKAFTEQQEPEVTPVPEVVPIEELTGEQLEAAEAEIEAEEEWPTTV